MWRTLLCVSGSTLSARAAMKSCYDVDLLLSACCSSKVATSRQQPRPCNNRPSRKKQQSSASQITRFNNDDLLWTSCFLQCCMHGMQRGVVTIKLSVRPSVCLSIKRVICDKMKETCAQIFSERELKFMFAICRRPSVCLSSVVCRLSVVCCLSVCNVRAPYSGDLNFRNFFFTIWYAGHLLTSV